MKFLIKILALFLWLNGFQSFAQSNCIECYNLTNAIESSFIKGDTTTALFIYEALDQEKCRLSSALNLSVARGYYSKGNIQASKKHYKRAVRKGIMGGIDYGDEVDYFIKELDQNFGKDYSLELKNLNRNLIDKKMDLHGDLIRELRAIYEQDQEWRRTKTYKKCKRYNFNYRLGFAVDSTLNHEEMMQCSEEFRSKDSILLNRFVDILDSIGVVPADSIIFNMLPLSPIINHTAHFNFDRLPGIYLKSVKAGTLSPRVYAWYEGYHEEYFLKESKLYFTKAASYFNDLNKTELSIINRRRLAIGLPPCPAVVWNTSIN